MELRKCCCIICVCIFYQGFVVVGGISVIIVCCKCEVESNLFLNGLGDEGFKFCKEVRLHSEHICSDRC